MTVAARHPGTELYRRMAMQDIREQRAAAAYVLRFADRVAETADYRSGDGLMYLGYRAASAGLDEFFDVLVGRGLRESYAIGLLTGDEVDTLESFRRYVGSLRAGDAVRPRRALGVLGRVREEPWLRARGVPLREVRRYQSGAYRFLNDLRRKADGHPLFERLPAFAPEPPRWTRWLAAAAVLALALVSDPATADRRDPQWVSVVTPSAADGRGLARLGFDVVLGQSRGAWSLIALDASGEAMIARRVFDAPPSMRLSGHVQGGAIGDLTGDGDPELVLIASAPLPAWDEPAGEIAVFTRGGDSSRWRVLDRLGTAPGRPRSLFCTFLRHRAEERRAVRARATEWFERARELCPSQISSVEVRAGRLAVFQHHYGRQYLEARCSDHGCEPLRRVLRVESDLTGGAWLDAGDRGESWLAIGTGCWRENGPNAYGVLVARYGPDGVVGTPTHHRLGGRTRIARLGRDTAAVLVGLRCEDPAEHPHLARVGSGPSPAAAREVQRLLVARLVAGPAEPALEIVESVHMPGCCGQSAELAVLRDRGIPRVLVAAHHDPDRGHHGWQLVAFHLDRALADQSRQVLAFPAARRLRIAAADVSGDGRDELVVIAQSAELRAYRIGDDEPLVSVGATVAR